MTIYIVTRNFYIVAVYRTKYAANRFIEGQLAKVPARSTIPNYEIVERELSDE